MINKQGEKVACKGTLIDIVREYGISIKDSEDLIDRIISKIIKDVQKYKSFRIRKFGRFYLTTLKGKKGIMKAVGKEYEVPETKIIRFSISDILKSKLNPGRKKKVMNIKTKGV